MPLSSPLQLLQSANGAATLKALSTHLQNGELRSKGDTEKRDTKEEEQIRERKCGNSVRKVDSVENIWTKGQGQPTEDRVERSKLVLETVVIIIPSALLFRAILKQK